MNRLLVICGNCLQREQVWTPPVCRCTEDWRDILDHAAKGDCPRGHYANAKALAQMEAAGMTPQIAGVQAQAGSCCDPPKPG